ncbi:hypothetical protein AB0J86_09735 [Micromonospora sp. NPDC049559]|uniref:hypothetical protein n=1 Tax=Micromonospora sp. NPDC049559 TaxID=3155923 RepID=UPI0034172208
MTVTQPLSDEERSTLKTGAFGAVFLISNADPGILSMLRESFAAAGALAGSRGLVNEVLTGGPPPRLGGGSPAELEAAVLPALRRAVEILGAKAPAEVANYRAAVLDAVDRVAGSTEGTSRAEGELLARVRDALGEPA